VLAQARAGWVPLLCSPVAVARLGPGRLCKLGAGSGRIYGKEVAIAHQGRDGKWIVAKSLVGLLGRPREGSLRAIEDLTLQRCPDVWRPVEFLRFEQRGGVHFACLDVSEVPVLATVFPDGVALFDPTRRRAALPTETAYIRADGSSFHPPRGSAAHAWRLLGLVDASGHPTPRGRIFSRFQGGEGLMIAAALEDESYPVDQIVCHLANLRGGYRFSDFADGPSVRLAATARRAFGHRDIDGYLHAGLCPGFGEGTIEAIEKFREGGLRAVASENVSRGDIERAEREWSSLLRHILHVSAPGVGRWEELAAAARDRV
jgi:hypothetical protein